MIVSTVHSIAFFLSSHGETRNMAQPMAQQMGFSRWHTTDGTTYCPAQAMPVVMPVAILERRCCSGDPGSHPDGDPVGDPVGNPVDNML